MSEPDLSNALKVKQASSNWESSTYTTYRLIFDFILIYWF